jgi:hypothetical protein
MLQINTIGEIILDRQPTGLRLSQGPQGTVVYTPGMGKQAYKRHEMPHARYSTSTGSPACGIGIDDLERDIRALLNR